MESQVIWRAQSQVNLRKVATEPFISQYDLLEDVQFVAEGGFGCIYSANWSYNAPERLWKRGSSRVALKSIKNSVNATEEFLRELKLYWESTNSCGHIPHCYGMTKNFKNEYMMVLEYAEDGNLRQYLQKTTKPIAWGICRKMLRQIAKGLKTIHRADLIHRDLHSGNILVYKDHQNLQKGQNKKYLAIGWSYLTSSSPSSSSISFGVGSSESLYDSPVRSRNNSVFTDNSGDIYEADSFASDTSSIISEFSLAKIKKKRNILGTIRRIVRKDKTKRANEISKMQKDIITEMTAYTYCPTHKNALPVWNQRLHSEAFYTSRLLNFPELRNTNRKLGNKISKEGTCLSTTTATAIPSIVLGTSVNSDCGNELQSVDAGLEDIFANFRLGV
ncbi:6814_t:CDS:2 [Ambispora gerdemannii]|uniref:6814_t:CDS:1 n=1 Tax=Ambispora gerdemannii TaxID=144530 RepID=A0A9N8YY32_9GLOM|nr:6814_t:CDS:2 [Ambispora gerdemannii]